MSDVGATRLRDGEERVSLTDGNKQYFLDMVAEVGGKLSRRPADSLIRKYFPQSRLDRIREKISKSDSKDLEWGRWQRFFLFLKNAEESAIDALEDDLRAVLAQTPNGGTKVCEFLGDESESSNPWVAGMFEIYAKATLVKNRAVSVEALDWPVSNGRNVDIKARIGAKLVCLECTTLGESDAGRERWSNHCETLKEDPDRTFFESQDAYTQGRRLFDKIYDKIAPDLDVSKSQLCGNSANVFLIGFSAATSDIASGTPSIGWALDELFGSRPTGNSSAVSLEEYLRRKCRGHSGCFSALLDAPSQISGVLLFNGCTLGQARINYNARKDQRLSHAEMAALEQAFAAPPEYAR